MEKIKNKKIKREEKRSYDKNKIIKKINKIKLEKKKD